MSIQPVDSSASSSRDLPMSSDLSDTESALLRFVQLTTAAERHFISLGTACPDHQVCRRLAFVRHLYLSHRLSDQRLD